MPAYRVYFVDRAGYIAAPPRILICVDDTDAKIQARSMIEASSDLELWQGSRLVELFPHK